MPSQSSYVPNTFTQLYYKLNGGATDSSGLGNNGTATNVTYVDGRFGQGGSFNSVNSYISGAFTALNSSNVCTLSIWVSTTNTSSQQGILEASNATNGVAYPTIQFVSGAIRCAKAVQGVSWGDFFDITGLSNNTWYNVVLTINGSVGSAYLNGVYKGGWVSGNGSNFNSTQITAGSRYTNGAGYADFLGGMEDEIIVENRAWSTKEIGQYYSNAVGRYQTIIV